MFWQKKSKKSVVPDKADYLTFYIEDGNLQVEFGFENIADLARISESVLNGRVRNSCIEVIESKIREGGLDTEADYFIRSINKTIKPSEYTA
jgi:hypothetical protein